VRGLKRDALGMGLRIPHLKDALSGSYPLDFFEVIAENYLHSGPIPLSNLKKASELVPVNMHGTSLNLLGSDPLRTEHLAGIRKLIEHNNIPYFTEHLCWSAHDGWYSHDLLPVPHRNDFLEYAVQRAIEVREQIPVPFGIENLSSYASFASSTMTEWEFYTQVVKDAGVYYMLDINNIYVSSKNHNFDPVKYLEAIDWDRVLYVHLAGHSVSADGLIIDTHDHHVCDEVWELYQKAWMLGGPFPTMVEWDDNIPAYDVLIDEVYKARDFRKGLKPGRGSDANPIWVDMQVVKNA